MPSLLEAFGIPFLEAMHCGLPVVATTVDGPSDYLVHESNALLSDVGNVDALAYNVLRLLSGDALRQGLICHARKTAAAFTLEAMARKTVQEYQKAISRFQGHCVEKSSRSTSPT